MKKILVLFLSLSMMIPFTPSAIAINEKVSDLTAAVELFKGVGIIEEDFSDYEAVATRAFATALVSKMYSANIMASYQPKYMDITESTEYMSEIMFMSDMGYIDGYDNGNFLPDAAISYADYSKLIVSMLGYDIQAELNGSYPTGYIQAMSALGISISGKTTEDSITNAELLISARDAFFIKRLEYDMSDSYVEGESLLEDRDVFQIKGQMTQTGVSGTDFQLRSIRKNEFIIGDYIIKSNQSDLLKYLGKTITAYVSVNEDDEYTLIAVIGESYEKEYKIDSTQDITWTKNNSNAVTLNYYEGSKSRTVNIPATAKYLYNGRLVSDYDVITNAFNMEQGNIRILFSNNEVYVFLNEYFNMVVSAVNETEFVIRDSLVYGRIELPCDDEFIIVNIYTKDGTATFEDIKAGTAISVFKSIDNQYFDIYISEEKVQGTVKAIRKDKYVVDGKEYTLAENLVKALDSGKKTFDEIRLSDNVTFLMDSFGKVADVSLSRADLEYAWMFQISYINDFEDEEVVGIVKLFDSIQSQPVKYFVKEDVKVNGVRCKNYSEFKTQCESLLDVVESKLSRRETLVKVKYKGENEITAIEIPVWNSDDEDRLRFEAQYSDIRALAKRISGKYIMDNSTTIIEPSIGYNEAAIKSLSYFGDYEYRDFEVYDVDDMLFTSAVILPLTEAGGSDNAAIYYGDPVYLVKKRLLVYDEMEGIESTAFEVIANGGTEETTLILAEDRVVNVDSSMQWPNYSFGIPYKTEMGDLGQFGYNNLTVDDIKPGDLIQVGVNLSGKVNKFRILTRLPEIDGYFDTFYSGSIHEPYSMLTYGIIERSNTRGIVVDFGNDRRVYTNKTVPVLIYDKSSRSVEAGSITDIVEGEEVIIRALKFELSFIVVIRD